MRKLSDFLDVFDGSGLWCTIWYLNEEDDGPLWRGHFLDIPYLIATLKLPTREEAQKKGWDDVINFRYSGEKEYKDKPGLVIVVKD